MTEAHICVLRNTAAKDEDGRIPLARLRLINDDIIVRMDPPREKTAGGIHIPQTVGDRGDDGIMTKATVLAVGFVNAKKTPEKIPIPGVEVGDRCVFVRYYAEQHSNKQIQERFEENVIRVKAGDILFVYDEADEHRVLGGV